MKKTIRIAKLELSTLFYSPIAWFLLIVFIFQVALGYTETMEQYEMSKQIYNGFGYLTYNIFSSSMGGLLPGILSKLYLYIPLITMGLMSRETSSGTIKLLYSSPVKVREIVFGKFVSMMVYSLFLIGVLVVFMIAGAITIPHFDWPLMFSGLLGIYLLLCAYSAIGLFMSCLTSYQVVAAISTFVLFAALSYVGDMWQDKDVLRDLTYSLAFPGRAEKMIGGLITTRDVAYFLVIIYIFLGLSIYKLRGSRESKPLVLRVGQYTFIVVSAIAIGYCTSRLGYIGYYDASATKTNTLSENAQKILKETGDAPLEITYYDNFLDRTYGQAAPDRRNSNLELWEPYLRFKPDMSFKFVYYYDSVADPYLYKAIKGMTLRELVEKRSKGYKMDAASLMTPDQVRKIIDLGPEQRRLVMHIKYKDRSTFLRVFNDSQFWPSETETMAALKRMMMPLPRIAFLDGGFERTIDKVGDRDYETLTSRVSFRYALVNQGFDVFSVTPDKELPTDVAALVIADPKKDFSPEELARIQKYIDAGGNLLIAGEPGKQSVLNPLLKGLGVRLTDGILVQKSRDYSPSLVLPYLQPAIGEFSKTLHNDLEDSGRVSMPSAVGLVYDSVSSFTVRPLLMTDPKVSWNKQGQLVTDSAEIVYTPGAGDERRAFATALSLTRKVGGKEQRIVVTSDADFISNAELNRNNVRTANFHFDAGIFGWFSYGVFPIDTSRPRSKDNRLRLSSVGVLTLKVIFLGVLPGFFLVFGTVLLIRRKRK
jgi:ABC-2 type transport system permease protein